MDWVVFLFGLDALLLAAAGYFTWESYREKEPRAPKAGLCVCGLLTAMGIAGVLLPAARPIIGTFWG